MIELANHLADFFCSKQRAEDARVDCADGADGAARSDEVNARLRPSQSGYLGKQRHCV